MSWFSRALAWCFKKQANITRHVPHWQSPLTTPTVDNEAFIYVLHIKNWYSTAVFTDGVWRNKNNLAIGKRGLKGWLAVPRTPSREDLTFEWFITEKTLPEHGGFNLLIQQKNNSAEIAHCLASIKQQHRLRWWRFEHAESEIYPHQWLALPEFDLYPDECAEC